MMKVGVLSYVQYRQMKPDGGHQPPNPGHPPLGHQPSLILP